MSNPVPSDNNLAEEVNGMNPFLKKFLQSAKALNVSRENQRQVELGRILQHMVAEYIENGQGKKARYVRENFDRASLELLIDLCKSNDFKNDVIAELAAEMLGVSLKVKYFSSDDNAGSEWTLHQGENDFLKLKIENKGNTHFSLKESPESTSGDKNNCLFHAIAQSIVLHSSNPLAKVEGQEKLQVQNEVVKGPEGTTSETAVLPAKDLHHPCDSTENRDSTVLSNEQEISRQIKRDYQFAVALSLMDDRLASEVKQFNQVEKAPSVEEISKAEEAQKKAMQATAKGAFFSELDDNANNGVDSLPSSCLDTVPPSTGVGG